jgi:hypothetical protein
MENLAEAYQRLLHQVDRRSQVRDGSKTNPRPDANVADRGAEIYKDILDEFRRSEPDNPVAAFRG